MMKFKLKFWAISLGTALLLAPSACTKEEKKLLCTVNDDCGENQQCDLISGLCTPFAGGKSKFGGTTPGIGGIRGAFDCAVDWDADYKLLGRAYKQPKKQGLASVVVTSPRPSKTCGDARNNDSEVMNKPTLLEGLKTGCTVRLTKRALRSVAKESASVIQVGFAQYSTDPNLPVAGFRVNFRPEHIQAAEALAAGETLTLKPSEMNNAAEEWVLVREGEMTGRYFELCDADDFSDLMGGSGMGGSGMGGSGMGGSGMGGSGMNNMNSGGGSGEDEQAELRLRFVANDGELIITEYQPGVFVEGGTSVAGRLRGYFDLQLVELGGDQAKPFGSRCTLPTDCTDEAGCLDNEVVSAECYSAECNPLLDQLDVGICGGLCNDAQDCGYHPRDNPAAYCLHQPGRQTGTCIQICSTKVAQDTCLGDSTCRPGSDFQSEFGGEGGPARCLARCAPSLSYTLPQDCPEFGMMMPQGDAGMMSMGDGGRPPMGDGGSGMPGDAGSGMPGDAGSGMPGDTGSGMPGDTGVTNPDSGNQMSSSPLGQFCNQTTTCPMNWACARQLGSVSVNGYCTKPCMVAQAQQCASGYTGPGLPFCGQPVQFIGGMMNPRTCGIQCGESFVGAAMANMCPPQMQCADLVNNTTPTMNPPTPDGLNDYCIEQ